MCECVYVVGGRGVALYNKILFLQEILSLDFDS